MIRKDKHRALREKLRLENAEAVLAAKQILRSAERLRLIGVRLHPEQRKVLTGGDSWRK